MATKSTTDTEKTMTDPFKVMEVFQNSGFGDMFGLGTYWAETFGEISSEFAGFLADRIKEDVKTQHRMLHCKDIGELQHVQAEFIQTAIGQYQAETGKLIEMSTAAVSNAMKENKKS